jgi:hypothetical protein
MSRQIVTSENKDEFLNKEMAKRNPVVDNQGRDLKGVKKHFDYLEKESNEGSKRTTEHFNRVIKDVPLPDWTSINGVKVLRSGEASHVGVPANGKETAANYDIIHWPKKEFVMKLKKHEVSPWLHTMAKNEFEEKTGRAPGEMEK